MVNANALNIVAYSFNFKKLTKYEKQLDILDCVCVSIEARIRINYKSVFSEVNAESEHHH